MNTGYRQILILPYVNRYKCTESIWIIDISFVNMPNSWLEPCVRDTLVKAPESQILLPLLDAPSSHARAWADSGCSVA